MRKLKFALFGNIYQAKKSVLTKALLTALEKRGADIYIDCEFRNYLTRQMQLEVAHYGVIDGDNFEADIVLSMGGDGTFLQTASRVGGKGYPIIGVNTGRLGFLADINGNEIELIVQHIYDGDYQIEERSVLEVVTNKQHDTSPYAVLKRDNSSMISIHVDVDGEYLTTYQADGIIVNTPTGSTGYALSVGGPIMAPGSGVLGIVAVAPHSLNVRPISLNDNVELELTISSRNHQYLVAIDGRSCSYSDDVKLRVRKAPYSIRVLKRNDSNFFDTLRQKLMWGNDVRN